jgi:hypothetical protein
MEKNLHAINSYLAKQAISLHKSNANMTALGKELTTPLIFSHVALRRIFSRGSLSLGGRFYGGWWESIPSKARQFITINGFATGEVDFSELHPRMLYLIRGIPLPANTGDLYDDGWRDPENPSYDNKAEPYKSRRKLLKKVFNALLNDEEGRFRLDPEDHKVARSFNLNLPKIKKILFGIPPAKRRPRHGHGTTTPIFGQSNRRGSDAYLDETRRALSADPRFLHCASRQSCPTPTSNASGLRRHHGGTSDLKRC